MIDTKQYFAKLAAHETLTEDEIVALLKELETVRQGLAYMASCQAATLEGLPKSTSKSSRSRHVELCKTAAELLIGNAAVLRFKQNTDAARQRCLKAAEKYDNNDEPSGTKTK